MQYFRPSTNGNNTLKGGSYAMPVRMRRRGFSLGDTISTGSRVFAMRRRLATTPSMPALRLIIEDYHILSSDPQHFGKVSKTQWKQLYTAMRSYWSATQAREGWTTGNMPKLPPMTVVPPPPPSDPLPTFPIPKFRRGFSLGDTISTGSRVFAMRRRLATTPSLPALRLMIEDYRLLTTDADHVGNVSNTILQELYAALSAYWHATQAREGWTTANMPPLPGAPPPVTDTTTTYTVIPRYVKTTAYPDWCNTVYRRAVFDYYYRRNANRIVLQVVDQLTGGPTKGSPGPRGFYASTGTFVPWPSISSEPPTQVTIFATEPVTPPDTSSTGTPPVIYVTPQITVQPAAVTVLTSGTDTTATTDTTSAVSDFLNKTITVAGHSVPMKYAVGAGAGAALLWYMGSKK